MKNMICISHICNVDHPEFSVACKEILAHGACHLSPRTMSHPDVIFSVCYLHLVHPTLCPTVTLHQVDHPNTPPAPNPSISRQHPPPIPLTPTWHRPTGAGACGEARPPPRHPERERRVPLALRWREPAPRGDADSPYVPRPLGCCDAVRPPSPHAPLVQPRWLCWPLWRPGTCPWPSASPTQWPRAGPSQLASRHSSPQWPARAWKWSQRRWPAPAYRGAPQAPTARPTARKRLFAQLIERLCPWSVVPRQ